MEGNNLFEARFIRLFFIILLCIIVYIVEVKSRLLQTEQYTWPKILNRMSADSEKLPVVPCTFKVPDFAEKLENNETWTSPTFTAAFKHGYTVIWLSVKFLKGKGITVSFFFHRTDSFAWYWPQNALFTLELLNQQHDSNHYFIPYLIDIKDCYYVNDATIRYTTGFISAKFLDTTSSNQYFKNGNAYLRVSHGKSIYIYVEWFMRQYFNMTISNYPARLQLIISVLLIIEFQAVCNARLREFGYSNETVLWIFETIPTLILLYILFNLGVFDI